MATYKYKAFDVNEKNLKGFVNASDLDEAKLILKNRGLNPLTIEKVYKEEPQLESQITTCQYSPNKCQHC